MLGKLEPFGKIPFFWTRNYNKAIQYVGHCTSYDETFVSGNVSEGKFIIYYIKDNKVMAAAGMGNFHGILTIQEAML